LSTTTFDKIVVASDVEQAVITCLEKWFPTYLREVERQTGWEKEPLKPPASYSNRVQFDIQPGEAMPKAVVISPGLFNTPTHPQGEGKYDASWQVAIGIAIAERTEELANQVIKMYGAAVRAIMVQHQSLESDIGAVNVTWLDESYDDLQIADRIELYKAAAGLFAITIEDAVSRWAGPLVPDESPDPLVDHEADTVDVDIELHPVTEDLTP
jgi:hypothetical protein